jgi:Domain of unknown function (DUF4389)
MEAQMPPPPPPAAPPPPPANDYPVNLDVDYPDRPLNRLTTFFRFFTSLPIWIVLGTVAGGTYSLHSGGGGDAAVTTAGAGGALVAGPALMIIFRQKYPRWWFDWNLALQRFSTRVFAYFVLLNDTYPSTDEEQYVRLDYPYPDARNELNRWMPLVKWFLAIPHYIVLFLLAVAGFFVTIAAWFAILFTGRYPRGMFDFIVGILRWGARVEAYAFLMVTDRYPPFRLGP